MVRSEMWIKTRVCVSPLLFIKCMDNNMKRANQEENSIEELIFADDSRGSD